MAITPIRETELYAPVKALLEGQGYEVKGEVGAADVVACRDGEDPVIVELKTGFSLALFHQAIERLSLSDAVYVCVPRGTGRVFLKSLKHNKTLCRRLGLGLITVRLKDGLAEIHLDPAPYKPRQSKRKKTRLLKEFASRVGDPNTGGMTRKTLMTAYRQDALRCAGTLHHNGATKAAHVAEASGVAKARQIMSANHYGWFDRVETGIYELSPNGRRAIDDYSDVLETLSANS
ncbi:MAG: DUF2161 family putative PD-(D/E)XK-type phosphodiesterase [Pseudomonadota bacterium]